MALANQIMTEIRQRTVQTWRPPILVAFTEEVTNARTESFNRIIKQTKRVGCGYRNLNNY